MCSTGARFAGLTADEEPSLAGAEASATSMDFGFFSMGSKSSAGRRSKPPSNLTSNGTALKSTRSSNFG